MARFNKKIKSKVKVVNCAGGVAFKQSTKMQLVSILLTSFAQDQFYRTAEETLQELEGLIYGQEDKEFVAKALLYARNELGMRSITHAGTACLVKYVKNQSWLRPFVSNVIRIPKDATEIFSYYANTFGSPFPNSLKRGVALKLSTFSEYHLAKNKGEGSEMSLVDVVNICHPKSTPALTKLMKGELKQTDTWESKLSEAGGDEDLKDQAWEELLREKKLGYLALIRNLRNIEQQSPKMIPESCEQLVIEEKIRKSLILPFQIFNATQHVSDRRLIVALNKALEISLANVPKFNGKTLIALDDSGSMTDKKGKMNIVPAEIGALFASILFKSNEGSDLMLFSDKARYQSLNPSDSISTLVKNIRSNFSMSGTDFHTVFQTANKPYDRIIILSDLQGWMGGDAPERTFKQYCSKFNCKPIIYSFDLAGYGTLQFPEDKVLCIAGFSDKIFSVMKVLEEDKDALIHRIEQVEIKGVAKLSPKEKENVLFDRPLLMM